MKNENELLDVLLKELAALLRKKLNRYIAKCKFKSEVLVVNDFIVCPYCDNNHGEDLEKQICARQEIERHLFIRGFANFHLVNLSLTEKGEVAYELGFEPNLLQIEVDDIYHFGLTIIGNKLQLDTIVTKKKFEGLDIETLQRLLNVIRIEASVFKK